jgi:hypothetical protein
VDLRPGKYIGGRKRRPDRLSIYANVLYCIIIVRPRRVVAARLGPAAAAALSLLLVAAGVTGPLCVLVPGDLS